MADQEDHRTEDETLPHQGEHELHAVADTVAKAVASSMQEVLQPLLRLIPSALATPLPSHRETSPSRLPLPLADCHSLALVAAAAWLWWLTVAAWLQSLTAAAWLWWLNLAPVADCRSLAPVAVCHSLALVAEPDSGGCLSQPR